MKKPISLFLSSALFLSAFFSSVAFAETTYTDVDEHDKYAEGIYFITKEGIVSGYDDGSYKPNRLLNRAEMTKIIVLSTFSPEEVNPYSGEKCFPDVPAGLWYTKYVCFAKAKGFVKGYPDDTFRPGRDINLVETLKITLKNFSYSYESDSPWYRDIVNTASENRLIPLDFTMFGQKVNRGQMADLIARVLYSKEGTSALNNYLAFLQSYNVTYETLEDEQNLDQQARDVRRFYTAQFADFENFHDPSGFKAVLYAENSSKNQDAGCENPYYSGNFFLAITSTADGEPTEIVGIKSLGFLKVPAQPLHGTTMDSLQQGNFHSFMALEEYKNCSTSTFRIYEPTRYYKDLRLIDMSDSSDEKISAAKFDDLVFGTETLRVTNNGQQKNYKWEDGKFVYQSVVL